MTRVVASWNGGKDSCLACYKALQHKPPSTVVKGYGKLFEKCYREVPKLVDKIDVIALVKLH